MRRSEAHQGVRMIKFLDVLGRYEASEFSQMEAAELLGIGERTFRRWRDEIPLYRGSARNVFGSGHARFDRDGSMDRHQCDGRIEGWLLRLARQA